MNCVLAVLQTYGATSSLSYSLFATMADSIFDPFSNITLWLAHRTAKKIDERKYPAVRSPFDELMIGKSAYGDGGKYHLFLYYDVRLVNPDRGIYSRNGRS
jgi:hypothetical protein